LFPIRVFKKKIKYKFQGFYSNKSEDGCLLGRCNLDSGKHWLMFHRSLVAATVVEPHHSDDGGRKLL
jgi:hypothetical protein